MKRQYVFAVIFFIVSVMSGVLYGQGWDINDGDEYLIVKSGECTAGFSYSIINKIKDSVMIKFKSNMPGSAQYSWDFGDGSNSNQQHPVHTYDISETKVFKVTLKVTSKGCSDQETQTLNFSESESEKDCSAAFTYKIIKSDKKSAEVQFTVTGPDPSAEYKWSFGDGKGTKNMNPTHKYKLDGEKSFNVKLNMKKDGCEDEKVEVITFGAAEPGETCSADFNYEITSIAPGRATVRFASKMEKASKYEWSFGDEKKSTEKNPVHVYVIVTKKVFEVTLYVEKAGCKDKKTKTIDINDTGEVVEDECSADFSFEIKRRQGAGGAVQFTSAMTGASSYKWDFGDGQTSTAENPSYVYDLSKTRTFTVTMEVRKGTCTDKKSKIVEFPPGEAESGCTAKFSYTIIRQDIAKGLVQFTPAFTDASAIFNWDFGDGIKSTKKDPVHTYDLATKQQFMVVLKVTKDKCEDTQTETVNFSVGLCTAGFTVKITYNDGNKARVEVTCNEKTPEADFTCNFGDGTISKEWNPVHTYNIALKKKYTITLRVRKGECDDQTEQEISF